MAKAADGRGKEKIYENIMEGRKHPGRKL